MTLQPAKSLLIALLAVLHLVLPPAWACALGTMGASCCCAELESPPAGGGCCVAPAPSDGAPPARACGCSVSPEETPAAPFAKSEAWRGAFESAVPGELVAGTWSRGSDSGLRIAARGAVPRDGPLLFRIYGVYRL